MNILLSFSLSQIRLISCLRGQKRVKHGCLSDIDFLKGLETFSYTQPPTGTSVSERKRTVRGKVGAFPSVRHKRPLTLTDLKFKAAISAYG